MVFFLCIWLYLQVEYEPGDHVGIFPENSQRIVDGILEKLSGLENYDEIHQLQILKETHTTNGIFITYNIYVVYLYVNMVLGISKSWEPHDRLPSSSVRNILTRFVDITTPPSRQLLTLFAGFCENKDDEERLNMLAIVSVPTFLPQYER